MILLFVGYKTYFLWKEELINAIGLLIAAVFLIYVNYDIANRLHKIIPVKKVYQNSNQFEEQKVWSLNDFSEKYLSKQGKYRR